MAAAGAVVVVAVAAAAEPRNGPAFAVIDAFGGFARLVRRSPTLEGSVSLRATQGCAPLLEGNELGQQLVLTRALTAERTLGRWRACEDEAWQTIERARRAALPMLRARGLLAADAWPELEHGVLTGSRGELRLWTGLCVRPRPGRWIAVESAANRRCRSFEVCSRVIPISDGWTPLVLELRAAAGVRRISLAGEVACLIALAPGLPLERGTLAQHPDAARGHLRFYAQEYFEAKKRGEITRRYRKTIDATPRAAGPAEGRGVVVEAGPRPGAIERASACLLPSGVAARVPAQCGELSRMRFDNVIEFAASYDGHRVTLDYDRARLKTLGADIEPALTAAVGSELVAQHPGALLYLTKYFTPHPPGEPHFFVKPWAFTMLPPGWSALIDGVHDAAYDVMRGVVHADQFFATPAVFQLFALQQRIEVPAGRPLVRVTPIPRDCLTATAEVTTLEGVAPL